MNLISSVTVCYSVAAPRAKEIGKQVTDRSEQERVSFFLRHVTPLFKLERIAELAPDLMADLERHMQVMGESGKFDPFEFMYSTVFQLTIRAGGAREVTDSFEKCKRLEELYWKVEQGTTATFLLIPWLPSQARQQKLSAIREIYNLFDGIIKARKREGRQEVDAVQRFIDQGDSTADIIGFIMPMLFAGIVNTSLMSAWIFIFLDQVPEWKDKVINEIRILLNKHAPIGENLGSTRERFSKIPVQAWEDEMPVLEVNPSSIRCNPGRYDEGQDKRQTYAFLGWGAGRHPCAGRRFAQNEIKSLVTMFLASYTYEVIDSSGRKPDPSVTVPDRNNLYRACPKGQTFYLKYTKRDQQL
ncbi:hypothetical protein OPQ81_008556 [Rhizoctonia solani]|nr:hypothetical protein OPQ81_008556 [Rhizoctonia solani]